MLTFLTILWLIPMVSILIFSLGYGLYMILMDKKEGIKYKSIGRIRRKKDDGFGGYYYSTTHIYSDSSSDCTSSSSCDGGGI